jgi:FkbM family methyltransferase
VEHGTRPRCIGGEASAFAHVYAGSSRSDGDAYAWPLKYRRVYTHVIKHVLAINMQRHSVHLGNYIVPESARNGVAVDIGGNTGQFSLKYKDFFSKIDIYEPQKECYEIITNNIKGVSNIKLYSEAVFHTSNKFVNLISHRSLDSGSVALQDDIITVKEWTNNLVDSQCKTISLEDILERAGGRVDYMKIDCETSEYHLLFNKDLSNIRYMGIELHWQMGKENFDRLVKHILQYFNKVSNESLEYPVGNNIELLFRSKTDI